MTTIWCDRRFNAEATRLLEEGTRPHRLIFAEETNPSAPASARPDPALEESDVAFGLPNPRDCLRLSRIRWVEISTAGYTPYDTPAFREGFQARGAALTNASGVFAEACAQHVLAMMLALGRNLLPSHRDQLTDQGWRSSEKRSHSLLLNGQTAVLLGFGAIGRRLAELLAPFGMRLFAVRRRTRSETGVRIVPEEDLTRVLGLADHVINLLPEAESTLNYVNARRIGCFRPGARFYNVGRGATVDQTALLEGLQSGRIGAAYLDVTAPEPLPPGHPLWTAPHCFITPHTAGGRSDADRALVDHFLFNLAAFAAGGEMRDRIL